MARTISATEFANYRDLLSKINKKAADEFRNAVFDINGRFGGVGLGQIPRDELINYAYGLVTKYGEASAAATCEMYDAIAALSNAGVEPAVPVEPAEYSEVAKTVNGVLKQSSNENMLVNSIARLVKRAGADTMLQNAYRDRKPSKSGKNSRHKHSGAQVAWVPSGDTCPFCIMLASRGWQQQSKWAADNHAEHIHANCDCVYMVRFDSSGGVAGYDPDEYLDMYRNADGETTNDKLNSIRRIQYQDPETRAKINAQKREAYALRTEVHSIKRNDTTEWQGVARNNSKAEISKLRDYADKKGIVLDKSFESYDGDIDLAKDFVDTLETNISSDSHMRNRPVKVSVSYTMEDTDYAETKGSNIFINGFAYRDRKLLDADYQKKVDERWFTQGSTYLDIATHESAHVRIYIDQLKTKGIVETVFSKDPNIAADLIVDNISEYAAENRNELIAESYVSYKNGSNNEYVLKVLRYCGIIK